MLAAKAYDMVMGVDIHILIIPPGVPTPIPHPHIGMLFDPMDFVPVVGATVHVNNKPRGQAGSAGKNVPPHIPLGGSFTKPPGNENEVFMGSATVIADGSPMSRLGVPVLSCHDVGMPSPPRSKKKGSKPTMYLPTSVLMAIPAGQPVMVGGPPTIDMMAMAVKMGMSSLGKLANSKMAKKASNKIHNAAEAAMKKAKVPANARNAAHKAICFVTGHPVDVATGKVFTDAVDIELPGPVPFKWERTWYSTSVYDGSLGHGWHHSYDMALSVDKDRQVVALRMGDGRPTAFPYLQEGEQYFDRKEKLTFLRDNKGWGVRNKENHTHRFHPSAKDPDILLLSRIEDCDEHAIEFSYDLQDHLKKIVDSGGRVLDVISNANGQITEIRTGHLPENYKLVNYYYDSYGDLVQVLDAADRPMVFAYQNHLLVKETNRNGLSFYFTYVGHDENAKCVHTWGDDGIYDHKITYKEGITEVTNSLGYKTTYILDGQGLVSQVIDANGNSSFSEYSQELDLMRETDAAGLSTSYSYDERGNETALVMADGATYSTQYNEWDQPVVTTDAMGNSTIWQYDDKGRMTARIDSNGEVLFYHYKNGHLESITDNNGRETRFEYDKANNICMVQSADGGIYHWRYDAMGNITLNADPKGNTQQIIYDRLNRIVQVNEADGNVRHLQYDGEGNIIRAKDMQREVSFEYGGMAKMHARIENNQRIEFIYDKEENLTAIKNEHGYAFNFRLDPVGDVIEEAGFDGIIRRYQRDGSGKLTKVFRHDGIITSYTYDDGGRINVVEHNDGSKEQFSYRPDGELVMAQNDFITVELERDMDGNVIKETQGNYEVNSVYDQRQYRTKLTSSLGASIDFEIDAKGDFTGITATNSKAKWRADFLYDSLGLEIERSLPGGLRSRWERDRLGRPVRHTVSKIDGRLSDKSYRWGHDDRLQGIFNELKNISTLFTHDKRGNLSAAQYEDGKQDYRMPDAVGNLFRTREQKDRKYGPAGQLLEAPGVQYFYDPEGNLIRKNVSKAQDNEMIGTWEYHWYASGMLKEVVRPDGEKISFIYDALGRRVAKTFKGNTTRWVWDGNVPLHEWVEEAGNGTTDVAATLKKEETELKVDSSGQLIAQTAWHAKLLQPVITWLFQQDSHIPIGKLVGDTAYSIITDHLGTPVSMHDDKGQAVWTAEYDIYGKIRHLNGRLSACPFRYQGQYEDEETGLYYNRQRYYCPEAGTYISQDPVGVEESMDAYNYVPDVNRFVDPFGLMPKFTPSTKGKILKENNDFFGSPRCEKCGCKVRKPKKSMSGVTPSPKEWQIDHIKADSHGGAATEKNGQVLCRKCNRDKSNKYEKNFKKINRKKTKAQVRKFCK